MKFKLSLLSLLLIIYASFPIILFSLDPSKRLTQYSIENWNDKNGLPQNSVYGIIKSKDGFIWFSTEEGFVRFDGFEFKVYNDKNVDGMKVNLCVHTLEDSKGNIWVASFGGVIKRGPNDKIKVFTTENGLSHNMTRGVYEDEYGRIWVATSNGINLIVNDSVVKIFTAKDGLSDNYFYYITGNKKGEIALASRDSGVDFIILKGNDKFEFININKNHGLASNAIRSLTYQNDSTLWVGTMDKGINLLVNKKIKKINLPEIVSSLFVNEIVLDKWGNLYLATSNKYGLIRIKYFNQFENYILSDNDNFNETLSLFLDDEGNLWVGSYNLGLFLFKDAEPLTFGQPEGLYSSMIRSIAANSKGEIFVGYPNSHFSAIMPDGSIKNYVFPDKISRTIQSFEFLVDTVWIGSRSGLFYVYNQFKKIGEVKFPESYYYNPNYSKWITALLIDENHLLIGTDGNGLYSLNLLTKKVIHHAIDEMSSNLRVRFIVKIREKEYYLGTNGNGLIMFNFTNNSYRYFTDQNGLPSNLVRWIYKDKDGVFWFNFSGNGITRLRNNFFESITSKEGLPINSLFAIHEDEFGNFWCASNSGILRVSKKSLIERFGNDDAKLDFEIYNTSDGLRNAECNGGYYNTSAMDLYGRIWFASIGGVICFDPKNIKLKRNVKPSNIYFNNVYFNNVPYDPTKEETITHKGAASIRIKYGALNFANKSKIVYYYKLGGYENKWHEKFNEREASYFNLSPGNYVFKVKCKILGSNVESDAKELKITILPEFYQTLFFKILVLVLLISSVYGFVRFKTYKQAQEAKRLENVVEQKTAQLKTEIEERIRIQNEIQNYAQKLEELNATKDKLFSIISHDLRNPIFSISSSIDYMLDKYDEMSRDDVLYLLGLMKNSTSILSSLIENLLEWSRLQTGKFEYKKINFDINESVSSVVSLMKNFANLKNISIEIRSIENLIVYADRASVDSILLNLITNAIKFSFQNSKVEVVVERYKDAIVNKEFAKVTVKDSGVGLSAEEINNILSQDKNFTKKGTKGEKGSGLGLTLCKEHIINNGGKLFIESAPHQGAAFTFTLPLA